MSSPTSLHIRRATDNDCSQLTTLAADVFRQTYGAAIPDDVLEPYLQEQFSQEGFAVQLTLPHHYYLVAYVAEQLVGFCKLAQTAVPPVITVRNPLELGQLYLHPDYQGLGIGSRLMKRAIETAVHHAYDSLWLCVWEQNKTAVAFYQKWGYKQVGTTQIFVGPIVFEDWVLLKLLNDKE